MKRSIIDCDIHYGMPSERALPYLPRHYREQIANFGWRLPGPNELYLNGAKGGVMQDLQRPKDPTPEASLKTFQENHLDKYNVEYAILTGTGSYSAQATPDADYADALCSAFNDSGLEQILSKDSRLRGSIMIPKQDPILSAKEIDRVGHHPEFVQVIVTNGAERAYGNRFYHPIYEACERNNLPFGIHVSLEGVGINSGPTSVGWITHYIEYRMARTQTMMAHLASFIFEGVFNKYPGLKVVIIESGVLWLAPYLWRMDQDWKALRSQTPWVKEPPSEYFRKHVRITSQPVELPPEKSMFLPMMNAIYAKECLMFASDYPHWDFDSPTNAFPKMDDAMWDRIFYQNAANLYGLPQRKNVLVGEHA